MSRLGARIRASYPQHVLIDVALPAALAVTEKARRTAPINSTGQRVPVISFPAPLEATRAAVIIRATGIPDSRWVYGRGRRAHPFPNHKALNGLRTEDRQTDPRLAVQGEDVWLGVSHYEPQDHEGCRCTWVDDVFDRFLDRAIETWPAEVAAKVR